VLSNVDGAAGFYAGESDRWIRWDRSTHNSSCSDNSCPDDSCSDHCCSDNSCSDDCWSDDCWSDDNSTHFRCDNNRRRIDNDISANDDSSFDHNCIHLCWQHRDDLYAHGRRNNNDECNDDDL